MLDQLAWFLAAVIIQSEEDKDEWLFFGVRQEA